LLRTARLVRAGLIDYREAWTLQRRLAEEVRAGEPEALVLCSHPPTVTLGRRATPDQLLAPRAALEAAGVRVLETDRGGGATVHNPGQLVGYPILRLGPAPDLHALLRGVERALVQALRDAGIEAAAREGLTGVWVGDAKIASIGMRFERGVTLHGFALNVDNDLTLFDAVVACGLPGVRATSVAREAAGRQSEADRHLISAIVSGLEREFLLSFYEVAALNALPVLHPRDYELQ
jgi:lipoate-protein ligase B